ncbi:MAG: anaerobic ribonucleoside-triphosphate reductase activating protein [Peptococcaceae bacterium]|nr:anaerobic ribonucleoside-triphosphate reductase activating protein [Peptococcaceae bacterium]
MKTIRLAGITSESVVDGTGIRYVVWAQGCRHRCVGCHSLNTWDFAGGQERNIVEIIADISKNKLLKGVTFSGGDPFEQPEKFVYIAREVKKLGLDIWCYTGYLYEEIKEGSSNSGRQKLLAEVDFLVDGPFLEQEKDPQLAFRGSRNQRIIDMEKTRKNNRIILWE